MANFKRAKVTIQLRSVDAPEAPPKVLVVDGWVLEGVNAAVVRATDGCIFAWADSEAKARASLRKLAEAVAGCDAARELNVEAPDVARLLVQVRQQLTEAGLAY